VLIISIEEAAAIPDIDTFSKVSRISESCIFSFIRSKIVVVRVIFNKTRNIFLRFILGVCVRVLDIVANIIIFGERAGTIKCLQAYKYDIFYMRII